MPQHGNARAAPNVRFATNATLSPGVSALAALFQYFCKELLPVLASVRVLAAAWHVKFYTGTRVHLLPGIAIAHIGISSTMMYVMYMA